MFQSGVKRFGFWDSTFLIDWASTQDESLEKKIELDFEELFYEETIHAFLNIVQKMRLPSLKNLFSLTIQPVLLCYPELFRVLVLEVFSSARLPLPAHLR